MNDIDSVSSDGGDAGTGVKGGREIEIGQPLRRPFAPPPSSRSCIPPPESSLTMRLEKARKGNTAMLKGGGAEEEHHQRRPWAASALKHL